MFQYFNILSLTQTFYKFFIVFCILRYNNVHILASETIHNIAWKWSKKGLKHVAQNSLIIEIIMLWLKLSLELRFWELIIIVSEKTTNIFKHAVYLNTFKKKQKLVTNSMRKLSLDLGRYALHSWTQG
jgi:hypothetical protein